MRGTKVLLWALVAIAFWVSVGMVGPIHTRYMLYHHKNGKTTMFESVGSYYREN